MERGHRTRAQGGAGSESGNRVDQYLRLYRRASAMGRGRRLGLRSRAWRCRDRKLHRAEGGLAGDRSIRQPPESREETKKDRTHWRSILFIAAIGANNGM